VQQRVTSLQLTGAVRAGHRKRSADGASRERGQYHKRAIKRHYRLGDI
jgi:hypothetical protein